MGDHAVDLVHMSVRFLVKWTVYQDLQFQYIVVGQTISCNLGGLDDCVGDAAPLQYSKRPRSAPGE